MIVSSISRAGVPARRQRTALFNAHIAAVLFGMTGVLGALINADATVITAGRALFALCTLMFIAAFQERSLIQGLTVRKARTLLLGGTMLLAHWVTFFVAIEKGGVAVATLGFASFPAFIALLDLVIFRERLGKADAVQLGLVTVGLILVVPSFDLADRGTMGLVWGLGSGFSFALLSVANRRFSQGMPAMQVAFWQNVVVAALIAPFIVHIPRTVALDMDDWAYLATLGVFCTGLSQFLFVKSLETLPARNAGMIIALEPVYAIACAWWLFHDAPNVRMLVGAALVVLASVMTACMPAPDTHRKRSICSSA